MLLEAFFWRWLLNDDGGKQNPWANALLHGICKTDRERQALHSPELLLAGVAASQWPQPTVQSLWGRGILVSLARRRAADRNEVQKGVGMDEVVDGKSIDVE